MVSFLARGKSPAPVPFKTNIQCLALNNAVEGLWIYSGEKWMSLRVPSTFIGARLNYEGPNPMTLFVEGSAPDGSRTHIPLAQVSLHPNESDQLLLIREVAPGGRERHLEIQVVAVSRAAMPPRSRCPAGAP